MVSRPDGIFLVARPFLQHELEGPSVFVSQIQAANSLSMKNPLLLTLAGFLLIGSLRAEKPSPIDPNALSMLKRMSATLSAAKAFSVETHGIMEVPSITGQFITLYPSGRISLQRPDKVRAELGGEAPPFDFYYDGTSVSAIAPHTKVFSTLKAPSTIDEMLAGLQQETGIRFPSAPILNSDPYGVLSRGLLSAVVVGPCKVNGVECDHLAFRSPGVNWEIWIDAGRSAVPRRLAITTTDKPNFPRSIVEFSAWNLRPWLLNSSFVFHPPTGFKEIPFKAVLKASDR